MLTKENLQAFRAANWSTKQDIGAYLSSVDGVEAPDLITLLGFLGERSLASDAAKHRMRCTVFTAWAQGVDDPVLFPHYFRAIRQPDPLLRAAVTGLLPAVSDVSRHADLCALFRSPDADLRAAASKVLQQIGGKTVLDTLGNMVREPDFPGRREVIELLVPLAGAWSIPVLQGVLEAGRPVEKRQALRFLSDPDFVGNSTASALQAVRTVLRDASDVVAVEAVGTYCKLCSEDQYFEDISSLVDGERAALVRAALLGSGRFPAPRTLLMLERKFQQGPTDLRLVVLDALEAIATNDIVPLLVEALSRRSLKVRNRASEVMATLSRAGKLDIARSIIWLLRSGDIDVRRVAADLARSVRDPTGDLWPKLLGFLRDEDWWVRERVVDALLELAGKHLSPLLVVYLHDPSEVIRRFAVEVLGRLKDPDTLGVVLRTATEDANWWVRERAIEALAAIGEPRAIPQIVNLMQADPEVRVACLKALGDMKAVEAGPQVAALLAASDPEVRLAALRCLEALQDVSYADALRPLADDVVPRVQVAALGLLTRWNFPVTLTESGLSTLDALLASCVEHHADDLILSPGRQPMVKRLGQVVPLRDRVLSEDDIRALLAPSLTLAQLEDLKANRDVDFSHEVPARRLRFRANVFKQLGGISAVFRTIRQALPELAELGLPPIVETFAEYRDGLVLIGGPTGSGKSTTLAALIDHVNRTSSRHVITLEDPIEVLHERKLGLVNQREIGSHTRGTLQALRSTLRQDPDVILVGEMRDLPTIAFAVAAAETGHLVFGTLHTVSADTTVDRVINAFPAGQQDQVRAMLAESLRAVLCQFLVPRKDGSGRALAAEVLLNNDAVANLIRKGKAYQVQSIMAISRERGMQSMDGELRRLVQEGLISEQEAYMRAFSKKDFEEEPRKAPLPGPQPGPVPRPA